MTDKEKLQQFLQDSIETEEYVRTKALEVLSIKEVMGNSYGVPTIEDIVDSLVEIIQKGK